jgi:hypothetical protein
VHVFKEIAMFVNPPAAARPGVATARRVALLVLAGSLALTSAACAKKQGGSASGDNGNGGIGGAPTAAPSGDPAGGGSGGASPGSGANGGTGNGSTGDNGGSGNNGGSGSRTSAPSGPSIVYFRLKQKPSCPAGTNLDPIAGKDAIVEWKVSGVDSADLAVDGPGIYDSYSGTTGSQDLPFGCEDWKAGQTATHTYLLTITDKNGKKVSKKITATAKVNDIAQV